MKKKITIPFHAISKASNRVGAFEERRFMAEDINTGEQCIVHNPYHTQTEMYKGYKPFQTIHTVLDLELDGENIVRWQLKQDVEYTIRLLEESVSQTQTLIESLKNPSEAKLFIQQKETFTQ